MSISQNGNNVDHVRFQRLVQVCNKALEESIKQLESWEKIQDCFPEYCQTREGSENLSVCQQQVSKLWANLSRVEFDAIFHERNIEEKLNQLDELIDKAKRRNISSTGTNNLRRMDELMPSELIDGNLQSAKLSTLEKLEERLVSIKNMNSTLESELKDLNDKVFEELDKLQQIYDDTLKDEVSVPDDVIKQAVFDMIIETRQD